MMFLKRFLSPNILGVILSLLLVACGSQGEISGGPLDELKPSVVGTEPSEFRSIKGKLLKVVFNKPINEASAKDHIRFYPKLKYSTYATDKTLTIAIKSDLLMGKNYYLIIEKGLKCYHSIPMERSESLIFCNDYLATNEISGEFIFEKEEDKRDTVLIEVYDEDTILIFEQEALSPGYQLKYLSQGSYQVKAFIDKNNNGKADAKSEPFWEKDFLVNKKYLVEPMLMGYTDTIAPKLKSVKVASDRRLTAVFDEDLTKLAKFAITAVADTLVSVSEAGDTVRTARGEDKVEIMASHLQEGRLSLLTSVMEEREYAFACKGLSDWKQNQTKGDTVYFHGVKESLATEVQLTKSDPAKNSGVTSLLPTFAFAFDRLLLPTQVKAALVGKEDGQKIALSLKSNNGFEFVYFPQKELENFTSYLLRVSATDTEGNAMKDREIEFITTEQKE